MNTFTQIVLASVFAVGLSVAAPAAANACGYLTINYNYNPELAQVEDNIDALLNDVQTATVFLEEVQSDGSSKARVRWATYRVKALQRKLRREQAKLNNMVREEQLARLDRF